MKLSKEDIEGSKKRILEEIKFRNKNAIDRFLLIDIFDTITSLHTNIEALANQYEDQGRDTDAKMVRRLGA